jgi:PBP1b-binding outer membrane lipoprotein LpoB
MKTTIFKTQLILITLTLGACASGPRYGGNVTYVDPKSVEQTANQFSQSDISMAAEAMISKLLQAPVIANSKDIVRIQVTGVKNLTGEYINTSNITAQIENKLIESGKVRFAGSTGDKKAAQVGKMAPAQYRLDGNLTSMTQRGETKSISYNFNLSLFDIQANEKVWGSTKEFRKASGY